MTPEICWGDGEGGNYFPGMCPMCTVSERSGQRRHQAEGQVLGIELSVCVWWRQALREVMGEHQQSVLLLQGLFRE